MGLSTTYTKTETDYLLQKLQSELASGLRGKLAISDTAPTAQGLYILSDVGTYTNLGGLVATTGKINYAYFDGNTWSKIEVAVPNILEDGSVTPEKTSFAIETISYGKNRFNKATITNDFFVNAFTGALNSNSNYVASDFVYVGDLQGENITFSQKLYHVAFYSEKNETSYISGREYGGDTIQIPQSANWLRCSINKEISVDVYQIEEGSTATTYEAYQQPTTAVYIPNLVLPQTPMIEKPFAKILLPSVYYLAYGIEYNFYFSSFMVSPLGEDLNNYYKSVFSYRGKFLEKKLRVISVDDFNMVFKVENSEKSISKTTQSKVSTANSGNGVSRKVLIIGDSTINNGGISKRVSDYFANDVMDVTLLGTRQSQGVNHEGRSGWTFQNYIESGSISGVANPFFNNGTFDFAHYLTTTSQTMGANDWVFIQLGINDLYPISLQDGSQTETEILNRLNAVKARLEVFINSIKAHNPNIRIGIIQTFPPAISQDATGNLLQSAFYSLEYYYKKGIAKWWEILLTEYDNESKRNAKIYLIGANAVIDRENDFTTALQNIDQYDSTQVEVQIDDVHPYDGYNQVGDMYIGAIKYFG